MHTSGVSTHPRHSLTLWAGTHQSRPPGQDGGHPPGVVAGDVQPLGLGGQVVVLLRHVANGGGVHNGQQQLAVAHQQPEEGVRVRVPQVTEVAVLVKGIRQRGQDRQLTHSHWAAARPLPSGRGGKDGECARAAGGRKWQR